MGELFEGRSVEHTNSGAAIANGDVVILGNCVGVALEAIAASTGVGRVALEGVFSVPKVTTAVMGNCEIVIFDDSVSKFDDSAATAASGDITAGAIAYGAAINGATTLRIKLTPGAGTIT